MSERSCSAVGTFWFLILLQRAKDCKIPAAPACLKMFTPKPVKCVCGSNLISKRWCRWREKNGPTMKCLLFEWSLVCPLETVKTAKILTAWKVGSGAEPTDCWCFFFTTDVINSNTALGGCPIPVKMTVSWQHQSPSTVWTLLKLLSCMPHLRWASRLLQTRCPSSFCFLENSLWVFLYATTCNCSVHRLLHPLLIEMCITTPPDSFCSHERGGAEGKQSSRTGSVWRAEGWPCLSARSSPSAFTSDLLRSI